MGRADPERWRAEQWRAAAPYAGAMLRFGWAVIATCGKCNLATNVDLRVIIALKGERYDLWNKTAPCKRVGCSGTANFSFKPPELTRFQPLSAEWPKGFLGLRD
jgi:hypothetical protein